MVEFDELHQFCVKYLYIFGMALRSKSSLGKMAPSCHVLQYGQSLFTYFAPRNFVGILLLIPVLLNFPAARTERILLFRRVHHEKRVL